MSLGQLLNQVTQNGGLKLLARQLEEFHQKPK